MDAADPATRSTLTFFQLRNETLDVLFSGPSFLYGNGPTDPLIASERCEALPGSACFGVARELCT